MKVETSSVKCNVARGSYVHGIEADVIYKFYLAVVVWV